MPKAARWISWILHVVLICLIIAVVVFGLVDYFGVPSSLSPQARQPVLEPIEPETPILPDRAVLNHIAYVSNDGHIWVVSPEGEGRRQLTTEGSNYAFPAWSPDGLRLAFFGYGKGVAGAMFVSPADKSGTTLLAVNPFARPIYHNWSPDGRTVAYLVQEPGRLALFRCNVEDPNSSNPTIVEAKAIYWSWSPEGDAWVLHENWQVVVLREGLGREQLRPAPTVPAALFLTPIWSPDGSTLYYVSLNEEGSRAIVAADAETFEEREVHRIAGFCKMVISSDSSRIAYTIADPPPGGPGKGITLLNLDDGTSSTVTEHNVYCFFWSPDGKKLAVATREGDDMAEPIFGNEEFVPLGELVLRWWIYDLEKDEMVPLISFSPLIEFRMSAAYFEQFSSSLSYWSPDSRYLVVCTGNPESRANQGTVWVVDTMGEEKPLRVAEGRHAVWSWR